VKDDEQLITESLQGDRTAFGLLVTRYQNRLFNTLMHVVNCREEAEDVAQEAFTQAYLKLDTFGGRSAFYTWLYRIAFNLAVSRGRRKRVESSVDQAREQSGSEPPDPAEAPTDRLLREERAVQVRAALQILSEEHRAILVLREMEGCCYDTISSILNVPVGTVRSRLHRARGQLREHLKEVLQMND